jgi:hypothetical protein
MKLFALLVLAPILAEAQERKSIPDFPGTARDDGVCFRIGGKAYCGTGLQVTRTSLVKGIGVRLNFHL